MVFVTRHSAIVRLVFNTIKEAVDLNYTTGQWLNMDTNHFLLSFTTKTIRLKIHIEYTTTVNSTMISQLLF